MKVNYAKLYGVKPNETDFSGAIKRSLKNRVVRSYNPYESTNKVY